MMITVTLYMRKGLAECDQARLDLDALQNVYPHQLVVVDIDSDPALSEKYHTLVPVVDCGPYHLTAPFDQKMLQVALGAASDRIRQLEAVGDTHYKARITRGHTLSGSDRFSHWFTRHYMLVLNLVVFIYVGLPFLAPVLMKAGATAPARVIYAVYRPLCHQLAFRSWFLFGEQTAYPRTLAGVPGLLTYQQVIGDDANLSAARSFVGNDTVGYKVALCQRDVAIYGSILLFGLFFSLTKKWVKSLPWYVWVVVGIAPIGVDGFSQLPSLMTGLNLAWLPIRESTPLLRTITGLLFGMTTAWYGYPFIEESIRDTRRILAHKIAVVQQTQSPPAGS
jgi:uncharacterized membrane protein